MWFLISVWGVFFSLITFSLKLLARLLAWGGWNCSAALHFRVHYLVMGRQNYFTGCLSALLMDIRSKNLSLYDFPMLKYVSSPSYWVCLLFSIGHGRKIYVALCDHTNHPSLLVTIKSFSLFLKALWVRFHYEVIPQMVKCLWTQRRQTFLKTTTVIYLGFYVWEKVMGLRWLKMTFLSQI